MDLNLKCILRAHLVLLKADINNQIYELQTEPKIIKQLRVLIKRLTKKLLFYMKSNFL